MCSINFSVEKILCGSFLPFGRIFKLSPIGLVARDIFRFECAQFFVDSGTLVCVGVFGTVMQFAPPLLGSSLFGWCDVNVYERERIFGMLVMVVDGELLR